MAVESAEACGVLSLRLRRLSGDDAEAVVGS